MCQSCIGCGKCTGTVAPRLVAGHCPHCGTDNPAQAATCIGCGWPLPLPPGSASTSNAAFSPSSVRSAHVF